MMTSSNMVNNIQELKTVVSSTSTPNIILYILALGKKNIQIKFLTYLLEGWANNTTTKKWRSFCVW